MAEKSEKYHRRTNENIDTLPAANVKAKKSPAVPRHYAKRAGDVMSKFMTSTNIITQNN